MIIYKAETVFKNRRRIADFEREEYARDMAAELMEAAARMLICGSEVNQVRGVVNQALDTLEMENIE